ncbi:hypothetical protein NA57DRAFT_82006 [Rhizodiscina lignyota]|uniref:Uncharacterized protein n=1 Tax=Rhizodiscina lignyota TaxID=1504668 RepID=A0A9P4I4K7_9PEZI|nr:hypothetical protein NA57DRAFT_82006 [Rhizodiscina lignyota]
MRAAPVKKTIHTEYEHGVSWFSPLEVEQTTSPTEESHDGLGGPSPGAEVEPVLPLEDGPEASFSTACKSYAKGYTQTFRFVESAWVRFEAGELTLSAIAVPLTMAVHVLRMMESRIFEAFDGRMSHGEITEMLLHSASSGKDDDGDPFDTELLLVHESLVTLLDGSGDGGLAKAVHMTDSPVFLAGAGHEDLECPS